MRHPRTWRWLPILALLGLSWTAIGNTAPEDDRRPLASSSPQDWGAEHLPLFVPNHSQFDPRVRFQMRQGNQTWWFTEEDVWVTILQGTQGTQGTEGTQQAAVRQPPFGRSTQHAALREWSCT